MIETKASRKSVTGATVGPPIAVRRLKWQDEPSFPAAKGRAAVPMGHEPVQAGPGTALAVVAIHGMGQQVPFSTMDDVARGLQEADRRATGAKQAAPVEAETVLIGDTKMHRLKTSIQTPGGRVPVHIFEAYWAPKTEGVIGLTGTMRFLVRAGMSSIRRSGAVFQRWMFGDAIDFPRDTLKGVRAKLALTMATLLSLIGLDLLIAAVGGAALTGLGPGDWPQIYVLQDLTFLIAVPLIMGGMFWWVMRRTKQALEADRMTLARQRSEQGMAWLVAVAAMTCFIALLCAVVVIADWALGHGLMPALDILGDRTYLKYALPALWVGLLYATKVIRSFLVQSVGDVAIYVSPQYLDAFAEKRQEIKEVAVSASRAVYSALTEDGTAFQYASVAFIGHSLGSVVAYDALNGMLNDDALRNGPLRALDRTQGLVTFGSPLDRTAYIFAKQVKDGRWSREALAASVQPLILSYKNRPFPWVNVFSKADIISSPLVFYDDKDDPDYPGRRIDNREDPRALTPVMAHTEYWHTHAVWDALHEVLRGPGRDPGPAPEAANLVRTR